MACVTRRRGAWVVDFRDQHGRRQVKAFDTRKAADAYLAQSVPKVDDGTFVAANAATTFPEAAELWLQTKQDLRTTSVLQLTLHVEKHLKEFFGTRRLVTIRTADFDRFKTDRLNAGLKPQTVNKVLTTARAIFDFAKRRGLTSQNPVDDVDRCKRSAAVRLDESEATAERRSRAVTPREVLSAAEMDRLIKAAPAGLDQAFLEVACMTGARVGELTALMWDDVDLEAGFLEIRRTLSWEKPYGTKERAKPSFWEPKTESSHRKLRLSPALVSTLKRWKLACPPSKLGLVFPTNNGEPKHRSVLLHDVLRPALTEAKLPRVTLHGLRHSCASALLAAGASAPEVADWLGHSTPDVTMKVYAHWVRRQDSSPMERLAAAMRGNKLVTSAVDTPAADAVSA